MAAAVITLTILAACAALFSCFVLSRREVRWRMSPLSVELWLARSTPWLFRWCGAVSLAACGLHVVSLSLAVASLAVGLASNALLAAVLPLSVIALVCRLLSLARARAGSITRLGDESR